MLDDESLFETQRSQRSEGIKSVLSYAQTEEFNDRYNQTFFKDNQLKSYSNNSDGEYDIPQIEIINRQQQDELIEKGDLSDFNTRHIDFMSNDLHKKVPMKNNFHKNPTMLERLYNMKPINHDLKNTNISNGSKIHTEISISGISKILKPQNSMIDTNRANFNEDWFVDSQNVISEDQKEENDEEFLEIERQIEPRLNQISRGFQIQQCEHNCHEDWIGNQNSQQEQSNCEFCRNKRKKKLDTGLESTKQNFIKSKAQTLNKQSDKSNNNDQNIMAPNIAINDNSFTEEFEIIEKVCINKQTPYGNAQVIIRQLVKKQSTVLQQETPMSPLKQQILENQDPINEENNFTNSFERDFGFDIDLHNLKFQNLKKKKLRNLSFDQIRESNIGGISNKSNKIMSKSFEQIYQSNKTKMSHNSQNREIQLSPDFFNKLDGIEHQSTLKNPQVHTKENLNRRDWNEERKKRLQTGQSLQIKSIDTNQPNENEQKISQKQTLFIPNLFSNRASVSPYQADVTKGFIQQNKHSRIKVISQNKIMKSNKI
eukprot:403354682